MPPRKTMLEDRPKGRSIASLRILWRFLKPYGARIALALVALVVAASTVLILGQGLRYLVDQGFESQDTALLDRALVFLLVIVFVMAAASGMRFYLMSWLGERVVGDIRKAVFNNVIDLSPAFFEITRTGEVMSRLSADTTLIQTVVGSSGSMALRNMLMMAGGIAMMTVTSPTLTGMVLLGVPLMLLPIAIFWRRVRKLSRAAMDRVADMSVQTGESLTSLRVVQAFSHEDLDRKDFNERVEGAFGAARSRMTVRAWMTAAVIFFSFVVVCVILWLGGHAVMAGRMTAGELSAFVFYAMVVSGSMGIIAEAVGDMQRAAGAAERLFELMEAKSAIPLPAHPRPMPQPAQGAVAFEHVTFQYPSGNRAAIHDFTLSIRPGERVALVGPSGSGKSTVFQLLLRFYDPQAGTIRVDGVDVREADLKALRARLGLVPQEAVIFAQSVRDNIGYGRPGASEAEIMAAAEAAAAHGFIARTKDGYGSFLGERGVLLSGGERQRIAIARAILRDPPVLLLDEATSALDAESERVVQGALERLMAGRTSLVIAHRLATVLKADRIVVMDQGRIVAMGKHEELMKEGGLYAHLASLQFNQGRG